MATDLGKVGIVLKGSWNSAATYEVLDAVQYTNGLYIAKQAVPANTLPTNTTYWQLATKTPKAKYSALVNLYDDSLAVDLSNWETLNMPADGIVLITEIRGTVSGTGVTSMPYFRFRIGGNLIFQTQGFLMTNARASGASFPVSAGDTITFQVQNQELTKCKIDFVPYE